MKIGKPALFQGLFKFLFLLSVAYPLQASAQNTDSIPKAVEKSCRRRGGRRRFREIRQP